MERKEEMAIKMRDAAEAVSTQESIDGSHIPPLKLLSTLQGNDSFMMSDEIGFEESPTLDLVKEEMTIEEVTDLVGVKEEFQKDPKFEPCPNPTVKHFKTEGSSGYYLGPQFACDLCDKKYPTKRSLNKHMKLKGHVKGMSHKCKKCKWVYKCRDALRKHMEQSHSTFQCEVCPKGFSALALLKEHSVAHIKANRYKCDQCSKAYKKENGLSRHKALVHDDVDRFFCKLCEKKFPFRCKLESHMLTHGEERSQKCGECDYASKTKEGLRWHISTFHPTETPFQCEVCSKSFAMLSFLKMHSLTHNEDKPHKCDQCSSAFKLTKQLNVHKIAVHDKLACRFSCDLCGKKFAFRSKLNHHMLVHGEEGNHKCKEDTETPFQRESSSSNHNEYKPHKCDRCFRTFSTEKRLQYHKAAHDKVDRFTCKLCGKKFTFRCKLKSHMMTHGEERNHKCSECDYTSKTKEALKWHLSTSHPAKTPFRCEICSRRFSMLSLLKTHSVKHKEDRPHKCDQCSSAFKLKKHLKVHSAAVHDKVAGRFSCKLCGKKFLRRSAALEKHVLRCGEEEKLECGECGGTFKTRTDLNAHFSSVHPAEASKMVEIVDEVKVEPVVLYDSEEKQMLSNLDVEIKHEPEDPDAN